MPLAFRLPFITKRLALNGSASGVVTVNVPRQKKSIAIDGGELYDSTH